VERWRTRLGVAALQNVTNQMRFCKRHINLGRWKDGVESDMHQMRFQILKERANPGRWRGEPPLRLRIFEFQESDIVPNLDGRRGYQRRSQGQDKQKHEGCMEAQQGTAIAEVQKKKVLQRMTLLERVNPVTAVYPFSPIKKIHSTLAHAMAGP